MKLDDLLKKNPKLKPFTEQELLASRKTGYKYAINNPENLSYWYPAIKLEMNLSNSCINLPDTKIVPIPFDFWSWLQSDSYNDEDIATFNDYLNAQLGDFRLKDNLFMKTGIFSDKFLFKNTLVHDRTDIGRQFLSIYYSSMIVGAHNTAEAVFRELIVDKENAPTIYEGMPLHTEYRVFYDFDSHKTIGCSNYWHPQEMLTHLRDHELTTFQSVMSDLEMRYNSLKLPVCQEVSKIMNSVTALKGAWSIDIMRNGDDFWLIDMARMHRSALTQYMEKVENI